MKYRGQKWLDDVLGEIWERVQMFSENLRATPPFVCLTQLLVLMWRPRAWIHSCLESIIKRTCDVAQRTRTMIIRIAIRAQQSIHRTGRKVGLWTDRVLVAEDAILDPPVGALSMVIPSLECDLEAGDRIASAISLPPPPISPVPMINPECNKLPLSQPSNTNQLQGVLIQGPSEDSQLNGVPGPTSATPSGQSGGQLMSPRDRFAQAVRTVITLQTRSPFVPFRKRTSSSDLSPSPVLSASVSSMIGTSSTALNAIINAKPSKQCAVGVLGGIRTSRLACMVQKLRTLQPTQDMLAHSGLVRCLRFSPNGKYLATSSWDRTSIIFSVGVRAFRLVPSA